METADEQVNAMVEALDCGGNAELTELFSTAYKQLRSLAHAQRRKWSGLNTVSTTVVVHEAYIRLSQQDRLAWQDRSHFFRIASRAMRFILVNYAERCQAAKRGGGQVRLSSDDVPLVSESHVQEMLALDELLDRLATHQPRWASVIECRAFAGLDVEETAEALQISTRTVKRDWRFAQAWIYSNLQQ